MIVDYSQNGESIVLDELFSKLKIKRGRLVDIGAGDGQYLSNTNYFYQKGWTGMNIDADSKGSEFVLQKFITSENVMDAIAYWANVGFDLLSIDIDGNDYWILDEILSHVKPPVIIFEVNSQLPVDKSWVMPYDPDHRWDGSWFYGMSYLAGEKLCNKHGYKIYSVVNRTNIIAVRHDQKVEPLPYTFGETWSHPENNKQFQTI